MNQPGKWWLGLVPLILLWIFTNVFKTDPTEADLRGRSLRAVQGGSGNLIDKPIVTAEGRDIIVAGVAFTPEAQRGAVAAAEAVSGVRLVNSQIKPLPEQKPYGFSVARIDGKIVLRGNAPLPAVRAKIVEAVRADYPGQTVVDEMIYAAGAPNEYEALVNYGVHIASKLGDGAFSLSGTAITLSGVASTSDLYLETLLDLKQIPRGATLARADILPPEVKPYVWGATVDGIRLSLFGAAPSIELRDSVQVRSTSLFGGTGARRLDVARGAPAGDFVAVATFALTELSKLSNGKATLTDNVLTISGAGKPNISAATIRADALAGLPQGFRLGEVDVIDGVISPYGFTASKQDGMLTLSGYIPDDKIRADIKDIVARKYFDTKIDDKLAIGKGAPEGFAAAVSALVNGMSRLAAGTASLSDTSVAVKGEAFYQKAIDPILAAIKAALPNGFQQAGATVSVKDAGPPLENAACQPVFSGVLGKGKILFETGSTNIDADSAAILDNLVSVANRCATATIEIGGHTDSVGSDESNRNLSKRRADAVQAYLVDAGVDAARLATEGYGETKPIASNDTDDGRAQNRRIEFLVK